MTFPKRLYYNDRNALEGEETMPEFLKKQLISRYGKAEGEKFFAEAQRRYQKLLPLAVRESEGRRKNLLNSVYPFAALYEILLEHMDRQQAFDEISAIMEDYTRRGNRRFYETLGKLPFFFPLFRKMFRTGLQGDSWEVSWEADDKHQFAYNIKSCLWHQACTELGYPELCRIFCRNDEINFTDVSRHLYFERTTTLGSGGDRCDFHFYPRKPGK